jgi:hypothetical protein
VKLHAPTATLGKLRFCATVTKVEARVAAGKNCHGRREGSLYWARST